MVMEQCPGRDKGLPHEMEPINVRGRTKLQCIYCGMIK